MYGKTGSRQQQPSTGYSIYVAWCTARQLWLCVPKLCGNTWPHIRHQTRNECVCAYLCVILALTSHILISSCDIIQNVCVFGVYTSHRVTIWSFLMQASLQILCVWSHTPGSKSSIPQFACMRASVCVCVPCFPINCTHPISSFATPIGYQPWFHNNHTLPHMDSEKSI